MTLHQRLLQIISIVLIVFGFVGFFTGIFAGIAGVFLVSLYNGAAPGSVTLPNFTQEDYDTIVMFMAILPVVLFEAAFQVAVGLLGNRGAKHPVKIKPFFVVAVIFLVLEIVTSVFYSISGYFDAISIAYSMIPAVLAVLCLVCAYNIRDGFACGSVKDIAEIKGDQYKSELGFVRVIQVLFLLNVCLSLVVCAMFTSSSFTFDFSQILGFINLVFDGVSFWLIFHSICTGF